MSDTQTNNPLVTGINQTHTPQPCTLVIFGGGGDLTRRKLLPAVYNQALEGELPTNFAVLGFAMEDMDDSSYRQFARKGIDQFSRQALDQNHWPDFENCLHYLQGSFDNPDAYVQLKKRLDEIEQAFGIPGNRVFYLAIPPGLIETCVTQLKAAGLVMPVDGQSPFSRIIVEKPIGRDLDSARKVNATLCSNFDEQQIYRIDHYLGKETVQNILAMRFGNSIFEPFIGDQVFSCLRTGT